MGELRGHWGRLIGATVAVLAATFVLPALVKAPDLQENRRLAAAPEPPHDWASLRAWPKAADAWIADHFPARPHLIAALNGLRLGLGVSGSDSVIVGRQGWLFSDNGSHFGLARNDPPFTDDQVRAWLEGLAGRTETLKARGAAYVVVVAPNKEVLNPGHAPWWYRGPSPDRAAVKLTRAAQASGAGEVIYPYEALRLQTRYGLKTFSPHDTHWTGLGAYVAYAEILNRLHSLGLTTEGARPLSDFTELRIDSPAKPRDLALMLGVASFIKPDYPEFADPRIERASATTWLSDLHEWVAPQVIDTNQAGKPVLLLTRDSFSNALMPFLQGHFSRLILAHDQDGVWRDDLIARYHPDIVMLEVIESGLPGVMVPSPPPSPEARRRIADAVALARKGSRLPAGGLKLSGGPGADVLVGGPFADDLQGRAGDDRISGGPGDDALRGGQGRDEIDGGDGDDWISGDRGDDILTGGPGADTFHGFADGGVDRVLDFNQDEDDRVELDPGAAFTVRQVGADTVVEIGTARLVLVGVTAASLRPGRIAVR